MHLCLLEEVVIVSILITHTSHLTLAPAPKVGGRGTLESHECIFWHLIAGFKVRYAAHSVLQANEEILSDVVLFSDSL